VANHPSSRHDPASFRNAISLVLTIGVIVSAFLMGVGLIGALAVGWETPLLGSAVRPASATAFTAIADNLVAVRPIGFAQLGLLVLLATPVVRVIAALVGFARERDRLYVAVSAIVLAILIASFAAVR
jgi:uncharacterized membrane protein